MDKKRDRYFWGLVCLTLGISMLGFAFISSIIQREREVPSTALDNLAQLWENELKVGEYVTIVEEGSDKTIDMMSRQIYPGDTLIAADNNKYEITKVTGYRATAKLLGKEKDIAWKPEWDREIAAGTLEDQPVQKNNKSQIAMYFTHTDESYVPTDGSESIPGKGGIIKVGASLAEELRKRGVSVSLDKTPHEPHDSAAYHRSRRTAVQLLKTQPIALIDVHRDGVPNPDFYHNTVEGQDVTKVRLVVGRQNPNMSTNLEFAKNVKAYIDKAKPGLIQGIFIGKGNYNQDLGPKAMLIEVGTHTNSRFLAQNGAALFADALPKVLGLNAGGGGVTNRIANETQGRSSWTSLAWILGVVLVGGAAFLFISTGSIKGMKSKLGEVSKTEFANYLGDAKPLSKDREKLNSKDEKPPSKDDERGI